MWREVATHSRGQMQPSSAELCVGHQEGSAATGVLRVLGSSCLLLACPFILGLTSPFQKNLQENFMSFCLKRIFSYLAQSHALFQLETMQLVPFCLWMVPVSCLPKVHPHLWFNSLHLSGNHSHKSLSLQVVGRNKWDNFHLVLSIEPSSQ